ncbi:MAG TPA: GNAT family N-acetyltransferase [Bacteroidales bacterium]|nr:GNAT family N-acetyltransferase [Bacteroidales bacterium]HRZ48270.1 GNAT family N-acetyltransferase [Bacteroidales bacterium]
MFQEIIQPISPGLIEEELSREVFVKNTNNGENQIYIIHDLNAPNTLKEIGRLREITFRDAGGGTGLPLDLDVFDSGEKPFLQLIVWNPADRDIVGGYRFIHGRNMRRDANGYPLSPTAEIFRFSEKFIRDYLPGTIELGRSWVQPKYQPSNDFRKGIYSLDNLWDGLGGLITEYPDVEYFFGKITMYTSFNVRARDLILGFMNHYFADDQNLVWPFEELKVLPETPFEQLRHHFLCDNYEQDYKALVRYVRHYGEQVPPLVNAYMNLTSTMKTFGTALNPHFGDVEETGILIRIPDIYPDKKERHLRQD